MTRADPELLPPVAITMGDPSGVGPEIIVKLAADPDRPDADLLVVGDVGVLRRTAEQLEIPLWITNAVRASEAIGRERSVLTVLQPGDDLPDDLPVGRVDARSGAAAHAYVQTAIDLALAGEARAIVTAPINKEAMAAAGIGYPGHTEILADRCGVKDFAMMLANDELRVLLVSIHLSLADAIAAVTPESELRAIRLAHQAGLAFGIAAAPRRGRRPQPARRRERHVRPRGYRDHRPGHRSGAAGGDRGLGPVARRHRLHARPEGRVRCRRGPVPRPGPDPGEVPRCRQRREHHRRPAVRAHQRRSRHRLRHRRQGRRRPGQPGLRPDGRRSP